MHVGLSAQFPNAFDGRSDHDVYKDELRLIDLAEPLGFDSVWGVEHHFSSYCMTPDLLQMLTWAAARTKTIQIGSMVVVLPWHDPIRVVEQVSMLDHMSDGRFVLGIGRGLGRLEFEGLRVKMDESRPRFLEYARMILDGLERGWCEHEGEFLKQPRREIRPRPFKSFRGRTYAAMMSPDSAKIVGELGVGVLINPAKPWDAIAAELDSYRTVYRKVHAAEPPPPVVAGWIFCDEDPARAEKLGAEYLGNYWEIALDHYELRGDHLSKTKGYEYYSDLQKNVREAGAEIRGFFAGLNPWGTPEQCFEKIMEIRAKSGCDTFLGVFNFGGMPPGEAERSMRLFAKAVLPELKKLPMHGESRSETAA